MEQTTKDWQMDVIPAQCIKFKLVKTALGRQINGVQIETIESASDIVEDAVEMARIKNWRHI